MRQGGGSMKPTLGGLALLTLFPATLLARGDGTFEAPPIIPGTQGALAAISADFNRDGRPDLAVSCSRGLLAFLRDPAGGGWSAVPDPLAPALWSLLTADFDGDGGEDLAGSNGVEAATVFLSRGDGTFGHPEPLRGTDHSRAIAAGDFDRDGHLDI